MSLYERFCQLDRNAKGFISADEFLSVPEFAMNPLSQVPSIFILFYFETCVISFAITLCMLKVGDCYIFDGLCRGF